MRGKKYFCTRQRDINNFLIVAIDQMKHIHDLNRSRPFNLINLLPEEIIKNEPPSFFIPTQNVQDITTSNSKDVNFMQEKAKRIFKKAGHATTIMTHLSIFLYFYFNCFSE